MRMRFAALGMGVVVLTGAWYFLGFKPASSELKDVKAKVQTTRDEIAALQVRLAALQKLKANEKQLRADAARMAKGLPTKPAVSQYIRQVQQIATESGLNFLSISPSAPADVAAAAPVVPPAAGGAPAAPAPVAGPLKTISVSLSADGSFFEVEDFVSKMERLERAVRIDTFSLGGGADGLSLSIKLQMFMQQSTAAPAPAAAAPAATTPSATG